MKIRPLHDWAVIKRTDAGEKTAGGIIIPGAAREKPADGIVEAIGPGKYSVQGRGKKEKFVPTTVHTGQRVVFTDFMARDVEVDGRKITLVREEDILGTYEEGKHLAPRQPHPVSVREEGPLLVPPEGSEKPAIPEEPEARAGETAPPPEKKQGTKEATGPAVRKKTKPVKEKREEARGPAQKSGKQSVKKIAGKPASPGNQRTDSGKLPGKTGGKKKVTSKKPSVTKKTVSKK